MDKKVLDWINQAAAYGLSTTNCSHDINNALAILLGYAENLEYMVESGEVDMTELQETSDKIMFGIEKLNQYSKHYAMERKKDAGSKSNQDFSDYFHRWLKVMIPQFQKFNYNPNFVSGDEYFSELNWAQVNEELCTLFVSLCRTPASSKNTRVDFSTSHSPNGLCIIAQGFEMEELPKDISFLSKPVLFSAIDGKIQMQLTCFSNLSSTESAA
jgi:hypothetical protein